MVSMNYLTNEKRIQIVAALTEGIGINAVSRMTGVSKNTVLKLLVDLGAACAEYQDKAFRNLTCQKIQMDEIWSFCYAKAKNLPPEKEGVWGYGDVWTWVSIDADTKLVPCWLVGPRNPTAANEFVADLAARLASKVQLTTDGLHFYLEAVEKAFGSEIDYAMLVKIYGKGGKKDETKYSPAECVGCKKQRVVGKPKRKDVSTSFVERQNLTMRMNMRRFTRLTNAFSRKVENHAHAIALHYMVYNFVKIHGSLRCTPAMAAGVTSKLWDIADVVALLPEPEAKKRGPYKKRISK
jgi:IS1 family transposase